MPGQGLPLTGLPPRGRRRLRRVLADSDYESGGASDKTSDDEGEMMGEEEGGDEQAVVTWASIMAEGHLRPQPGERAGAAMACRGARWGYMLSCSHWQLIATELVATGGGEHAPPS